MRGVVEYIETSRRLNHIYEKLPVRGRNITTKQYSRFLLGKNITVNLLYLRLESPQRSRFLRQRTAHTY